MSEAAHPPEATPSERSQIGSIDSLTAIGEVLEAVSAGGLEVAPVLEAIAKRSEALCGADYSSVYMREGELFHLAASCGGTPEFREYEHEHPMTVSRETMAGRVAMERRAVHIPDVKADPDYWWPDAQRLAGYRTVLGLPIELDGEIIGVIGVARNEVNPFSDEEIATISVFAAQTGMAVRLANLLAEKQEAVEREARLFETVERQRTELARYAPHVASLLSRDEGEALLAGHRREITALFCDLRGFTSFAETAEPEEVLGVLREYHAAIGALVVQHGGTVEHFAGDGLMVFFNDPTPLPAHRGVAIRTALAMQDRFASLAVAWRKLGYELGLGIGVAVGYATIGRIGFEGRYDYGAVGNVVILASRLSEAAAPGEILVSQRLFAAVEDEFEAQEVEPLPLKGLSRPAIVHRIIRDRSQGGATPDA